VKRGVICILGFVVTGGESAGWIVVEHLGCLCRSGGVNRGIRTVDTKARWGLRAAPRAIGHRLCLGRLTRC